MIQCHILFYLRIKKNVENLVLIINNLRIPHCFPIP